MMENRRLEQEKAVLRPGGSKHLAHNYKRKQQYIEELQSISPAFRRISRNITPPSPEQWRSFSKELGQKLESSKAPFQVTLRDRLTSTDSKILRWMWIVIALLVLAAVTCAIALTLSEPPAAIAALYGPAITEIAAVSIDSGRFSSMRSTFCLSQ